MAAFRVFLIAVALTAPVWALNAIPVYACSCVPGELTFEDQLRAAEIVVVGHISNVELVDSRPPSEAVFQGGYEVESRLDATEYLRGSGPPSIIVASRTSVYLDDEGKAQIIEGSGADCGFGFELGGRYLLYFEEAQLDSLATSACAMNKVLIQDESYLAELVRILQEPPPQATVVDLPDTGTGAADPNSSLGWQVAAASVALAAAASAIFVAVRRRRV